MSKKKKKEGAVQNRALSLKEISADHPNENKQRLFIQSLLQQGSQPPSSVIGRDSEAGGGLRKLPSGEEGGSGCLMGAGDPVGAGHGCQKKGHPG